jgi:hypothetical protein
VDWVAAAEGISEAARKVQSLHSTRQPSERSGKIEKIPFKSAAYLNEKHSRSNYVKYVRQNTT